MAFWKQLKRLLLKRLILQTTIRETPHHAQVCAGLDSGVMECGQRNHERIIRGRERVCQPEKQFDFGNPGLEIVVCLWWLRYFTWITIVVELNPPSLMPPFSIYPEGLNYE